MKIGEKYPVPYPICPLCGEMIEYRKRGHCRKCSRWIHQKTCGKYRNPAEFICFICQPCGVSDWKEICEALGLHEHLDAGVLLFAILEYGLNIEKLQDVTGLSEQTITAKMLRLKESGLLTDKGLNFDEEFLQGGLASDVCFSLYCFCADGIIRRENDEISQVESES